MTRHDSRLPGVFYVAIEQEIRLHENGVREYDLITALKDRGFFGFLPDPPAEPHHLFRAHFLLFHALYQLRDRLLAAHEAILQIHALDIRLLPWCEGDTDLAAPDPLRAYYLDWANLDRTTAADVEEMIASFWKRIGQVDNRAAALAELGLEDPVDDDTIKQAWRRLAMEHHPDRGGETERLQAINAAVDLLLI